MVRVHSGLPFLPASMGSVLLLVLYQVQRKDTDHRMPSSAR